MTKLSTKCWKLLLKLAFLSFAALFATMANAAVLLPNGEQTFVDANGVPLAGGSVFFYIPSTTTFKTTWVDQNESTPNTNPVILDSAGRAVIWGSGTYRQIVKDSAGNIIWDRVTSGSTAASGAIIWGGSASGSANAQAVTAGSFTNTDGQVIGYLATHSNTGAATLSVSGGAPIPIVQDATSGPTQLIGGQITAGNAVLVLYDSSINSFHLVNPADTNSGYFWGGTAGGTGDAITISAPGFTYTDGQTVAFIASGTSVDFAPTLAVSGGAATPIYRNTSAGPKQLLPYQITTGNVVFLIYSAAIPAFVMQDAPLLSPTEYGQYANLAVDVTSNSTLNVMASSLTLNEVGSTSNLFLATAVSQSCNIATSGANGLDTGAEASNTWYSVWIIANYYYNTACLLSTSATTPTLPTGYNLQRRVGWVRNNGSSNFWQTQQFGDTVQIDSLISGTSMISGSSGNPLTPTWTAVSTGSYVPSTSYSICMSLQMQSAGTAIAAPANTYSLSSTNILGFQTSSASVMSATSTFFLQSSNVYYASNVSNTYLAVCGWQDKI